MKNVAKFFAGWLIIFGTLAVLIAPFVWGGATVGAVCAFFLVPQILRALLK